MSRNDYIISKALRNAEYIADAIVFDDEDFEKGLPSIVRAGGGGYHGEGLRSMKMLGRRYGKDQGPMVATARSGRETPRSSMKRRVAATEGMLTPNTSQAANPRLLAAGARLAPKSQAGSDGFGAYTNRKAALARVTSRRQELQRGLRPVQINNGSANRPAF